MDDAAEPHPAQSGLGAGTATAGPPLPPVLTAQEVELVLQQPNIADRSACATAPCWRCFTRRECGALKRALKLFDLQHDGAGLVRQGKGRKDRLVPMGERALAWLR